MKNHQEMELVFPKFLKFRKLWNQLSFSLVWPAFLCMKIWANKNMMNRWRNSVKCQSSIYSLILHVVYTDWGILNKIYTKFQAYFLNMRCKICDEQLYKHYIFFVFLYIRKPKKHPNKYIDIFQTESRAINQSTSMYTIFYTSFYIIITN